ncbi:hypothetical protein MXAN_5901 [Myxococcus xanthus DK 1622]|uniref:Uncharacterized protein n=1 Tax=Myxococcus xanthus (strain DK1622) TaxID=246197 RepID=Q1CZY5_MYXXD|nr:hypothetical protein MXAN_5901 [Myxococcus xanthus DK 1622]
MVGTEILRERCGSGPPGCGGLGEDGVPSGGGARREQGARASRNDGAHQPSRVDGLDGSPGSDGHQPNLEGESPPGIDIRHMAFSDVIGANG